MKRTVTLTMVAGAIALMPQAGAAQDKAAAPAAAASAVPTAPTAIVFSEKAPTG